MDEFNNEYNPIDEYSSIDAEEITNTGSSKEEVEEKPVEVETAYDEDDAFLAFEKAERETPHVVAPTQNPQYGYNQPPVNQAVPQPQQPQYQQPVYQPQQYPGMQYIKPVTPQAPPQYYPPQPAPVNPVHYQAPPVYKQPYNQVPVNQNTNPYVNQNHNSNPNVNQNPYAQQYPVKEKAKTPTGTKVLIGVLIGLLVVFMVAFFVSCSKSVFGNSNPFESGNPLEQYGTESIPDDFGFYGEYGETPFGDFDLSPQYQGDYYEEEITLQADEGQTQVRTDDKDDSTYAANKDAKGLQFKDLPKDKDDKKYTSQYAYDTVTDTVVSVVCYEDEITDNEEDIISEGTGTIISSDGYIVTNSHVIGDSKLYTINIVLNNSKEYKAKIVGFDTRTDLAVLKIDAKDLTYATFYDSSKIKVGQDIVAIGNPGGQSFQNSLTKGIVSAVDRELMLSSNVNYIQIDAAINPGNSGGPLCNLYGQVIGINTAKIGDSLYEGMGFAIPSNTVSEICNDLIHYGYVKDRVMLGLMGYEVNEEMVYSYDVPNGILITQISENGPLDNTDIEEYDIITEINGVTVATFQEVFKELEKYKSGDKITLTYYRLES